MDKFGIFKLLNSFLNISNDSSSQQEQESQPNSSNSSDLLSSLLKGLNNGENKNNVTVASTQTKTNSPKPNSFAPLQSQMLSTMSMHDELIKRVKQNSKN